MRRNLWVLGCLLFLGLLLGSLPTSRTVAARSDGPKLAQADAAAKGERPSVPRLTAWLQSIRPRVCRLTSAPSDALVAGSVGFPDVASVRISRQPVAIAFGHISAGARSLFPRAPPTPA